MIREGEPQVTLKFLAESPSKLAISNFSDGMYENDTAHSVHILCWRECLYETSVDGVLEFLRNLLDTLLTKYGNQPRSKGATSGTTITIYWRERRHIETQGLTGSERDKGG